MEYQLIVTYYRADGLVLQTSYTPMSSFKTETFKDDIRKYIEDNEPNDAAFATAIEGWTFSNTTAKGYWKKK